MIDTVIKGSSQTCELDGKNIRQAVDEGFLSDIMHRISYHDRGSHAFCRMGEVQIYPNAIQAELAIFSHVRPCCTVAR